MEVGNASCLLALGMLGQDATQPVPDVLPSLIGGQVAHRVQFVRESISFPHFVNITCIVYIYIYAK